MVDPNDIDYDAASEEARRSSKSQDLVCSILENYAIRDPKDAPHTIHIHLFENPVEILGRDGHVVGIRTERTELDGKGGVRGTGKFTDWPVQAVYRAVGYRSDAITGLPFDEDAAVIPNDGGHVVDVDGNAVSGVYVTGWIKRGPVGLIGNTKSDAKETIDMLLHDAANDQLPMPGKPGKGDIVELLEERNITYTTWDGWYRLDAEERRQGELEGRERKKIVEWDEMVNASNSVPVVG